MLFLLRMSKAGYPFKPNELTVDEWLDMGILKAELEVYIPNGK